MKNRAKKRAFLNMLYQNSDCYIFWASGTFEEITLELDKRLKIEDDLSETKDKYAYEYHKNENSKWNLSIKAINLGLSLGYSFEEIKKRAIDFHIMKFNRKIEYAQHPLGETRDNKKTHNFRGDVSFRHSTNACKHRYPSKKRSKKTWKNFYALFPHLAKRDNWNGTTSDRM